MEYLRGKKSVAELCNKYQVYKANLFRWVQEIEDNIEMSFDSRKILWKQKKLENQIEELKRVIGELTIELKNTRGNRLLHRKDPTVMKWKLKEKDGELLEQRKEIKAEHPKWGVSANMLVSEAKGLWSKSQAGLQDNEGSGIDGEQEKDWSYKTYRQVWMKIKPSRAYEVSLGNRYD